MKSYTARYSDGQTAQSKPVTLRFATQGLEIAGEGLQTLRWPYETLAANVPLTASTPKAIVKQKSDLGVTVFVEDNAAILALREKAPQLAAGRWRRAVVIPAVAFTLLIAGTAVGISYSGLRPAKTMAGFIPQEARVSLGNRVVKSLTRGRPRCSEPDGMAALNRLMNRLNLAAGLERPYEVRVVKWGLVNAFAVPGGTIVLTSGLIRNARNPDSVAGVIAHEIGHGLELHPEAGVIRAFGLSAASELFLAGSSGTLKNAGLILTALSYTRQGEREADAHAARILRKASISTKPLGQFFLDIEKRYGGKKGANRFSLLRSHPENKVRAALFNNQPSYPATPALSADEWKALRTICGKPLTAEQRRARRVARHRETIRRVTEKVTKKTAKWRDYRERAFAYQAQKNYYLALQDFNKAIELRTSDPNLFVARAQLHYRLKAYDKQVDDLTTAIGLKPDSTWFRDRRARANMRLQRWEAALEDHNALLKGEKKPSWRLKNRAETFFHLKRYEDAMRDLDVALAQSKRYLAARGWRSRVFLAQGKPQEALGEAEEAIKIVADSPIGKVLKAQALEALDRRDEALALYRGVVERFKKSRAKFDPTLSLYAWSIVYARNAASAADNR
ncbi:MAG: M48 family metalloprotease [Pseudomonadota bacterium]